MKKRSAIILLVALAGVLFAADSVVDPIPDPVSNNAVALQKVHGQLLLFSFMGMGPKKTWDAITNSAFSLDTRDGKWAAIHAVPGLVGRIAAVAAAAHDNLYLFGGYVMDARGGALIVPDVGIYHPSGDRWLRGADLPIPV